MGIKRDIERQRPKERGKVHGKSGNEVTELLSSAEM
jgi:hypothetical protein